VIYHSTIRSRELLQVAILRNNGFTSDVITKSFIRGSSLTVVDIRNSVGIIVVSRRNSDDRGNSPTGVEFGSNNRSNYDIGRRVLAFVRNWSAGCEHEERGACDDGRELHG
jgi:hypothetical protein